MIPNSNNHIIRTRLNSIVVKSFKTALANKVLAEICKEYRFDSDWLYIPEERFTNSKALDELISEGLAFREEPECLE